jgi:capsular exopolysaccharide synthesis family protein
VLEPANLPLKPGKPNRVMLILLAVLAGGVVGIGTVMVVEHHDQSVKDADEVENMLGLPVLGVVPRVEELDRSRRRRPVVGGAPGLPESRDQGLLHRLKVESPLGLEFRRIFLRLAKTRGRTLPRTIMVTSATRGEGKTTTAASLAITLARELREKMLLVDFDLRSPKLHRALGLPSSSWGLAQMLQSRHFDERFVRSTVIPELDFLGAGKSERPAAELLDSQSVEWFLQEARARYPLVLVDAAPNLAVPDPLIIGRAVEGVIYVIRAGSTIRKAAEYGVKVQREACDNVIGVLMNDLGEVLAQYYGYRYNAYGYEGEVAGGDH